MSQYKSGEYRYGFDPPMSEYFLMKENGKGDFDMIVGTGAKLKGKGKLLDEIEKRNIEIPEDHLMMIAMDLPL